MVSTETLCLFLVIPANILYTLAAVTHAWFELPPHSFYGLWWVRFCDYLRCQIIPAFLSEEPLWYHVLQALSLVSWSGLGLSLAMLLSSRLDKCLPRQLLRHRSQTISFICLLSVLMLSSSLIVFYTKLDESSPHEKPQMSWSFCLAGIAGLCEFVAGILLLQAPG